MGVPCHAFLFIKPGWKPLDTLSGEKVNTFIEKI
jgi:hypothetical protein